jgi:hypothetical protein
MEDSSLRSGALAAAEPAGTGVFVSVTPVAVVGSAALLNSGDTADRKEKRTIAEIFTVRRVFP